MASKFTHRSHETELMDDLESSGAVINQTLLELEMINKLLGGNHVTIDGFNKLIKKIPDDSRSITIVDLGCGGGDMLKLIAKWGRKKKLNLNLVGIDANPNIVAFAQQNTRSYPEINYKAINIFSDEFKIMEFDIVTATLFIHHFSDQQLIAFFNQLSHQARIGVVINDIHRNWFAYHSIKWLTAAFSKSEMVRNDAAVSVLRSFHKDELDSIMNASGISKYTIQWMWAFRWQVVVYNHIGNKRQRR